MYYLHQGKTPFSERKLIRSVETQLTALSSTTGEPKAVLTEHRAGSTSAIEHGTVECVEPHSRVLQFASYTFDVSTSETLTTLIRGGTVCIPSEADRLERLAEVINEMKINHCFLTRMTTPLSLACVHHANCQ
jgi:non-ribosomal peptide synthetase component F